MIERARPPTRSDGTFPRPVDRRSPCRIHDGDSLDACERRLRRGLERAGTTRRQGERSHVLGYRKKSDLLVPIALQPLRLYPISEPKC